LAAPNACEHAVCGVASCQSGGRTFLCHEGAKRPRGCVRDPCAQAVLLAGFRAEEVVIARVVLDAAGGEAVKVVPVTGDMLHMELREALQAPEPDWEQPRPPDAPRGGGWGSQRALLISGLGCVPQL
jgi:hypothetical protein